MLRCYTLVLLHYSYGLPLHTRAVEVLQVQTYAIFNRDSTQHCDHTELVDWHRDIPYIVSGMTPFRALLLVHFSQCLFERIFFHIGESRAMKGVIFFSFSKF